jgi:Mg/Co/Ni transporter MgtE
MVMLSRLLRHRLVMRRDMVTVGPLEPGSTAAKRAVEERLAALPVVARNGRLLGAITVDTAVALLVPATRRDQIPRVFS